MKIGLSFIMKNESKILLRMMNSCLPLIDEIYCLDTGSTDESIEIVQNFIKEHDLRGEVRTNTSCTEIIEGEECFMYDKARNLALDMIKGKCEIGYWQDADEQLMVPVGFNKELFIQDFKNGADVGITTVNYGASRYSRNSFFRTSKPFRWSHAVHEILQCSEPVKTGMTNLEILVTPDGATWNESDIKKKYLKHALILQREVEKNNDPRDIFYCGNSFKDSGDADRAIEWYRKRVERTDGFFEERYYSQWYIGILKTVQNKPTEEIIFEYLKSHELDTLRGEGILNIICELQNKGMWNSSYIFSRFAVEKYHQKNPYPNRHLFLDHGTYHHKILDAHIINCQVLGYKDEINMLKPKNTIDDLFNSIPSAWTGHREFAGWLVNLIKPKIIVDLGVDYGYSTFSFAVPNIGTVYAIDLFEGDKHTGIRNTYEEFTGNVKWLEEKHNISNIVVEKGLFNEIEKQWTQKIDILHIDGLHTYDAVKNDFETWEKYLTKDSVVLFHDIESFPEVKKFWSELSGHKYEFKHSAGLGVLCMDKETLIAIKDKYNPQ